jgi:(p)ppGpp synthase/HD superfamily hydrolase
MAQFLYLDSSHRDVLKAASFASRRFDGRMRENPPEQQIEHAYRVANLVRNLLMFEEPSYSVLALLHDVLEKTPTGVSHLKDVFGESVARDVETLSKPPGPLDDEAEAAYVQGILDGPDEVVAVKIADLIDNLVSRFHFGQHEETLAKARGFLEELEQRKLGVRLRVARQVLSNTIDQIGG